MTISIDGLVSGLDTSAIIESLIELEEKPIKLKEDKQSILAKEKTAWEKIKEKLLLLEKSADKLDSRRDFSSYSGKFINHNPTTGSVLTVAANSSANVGSYDIAVSNLAKRQKSVSDQSYADKNVALGIAGSLTINDGADHTINITTDMTIEDVKDKINQSAANIVATISNSGSELSPAYQIILTSDDEGIANSFTTTVSLTSGSLAFNVTTPAEDAILTLDGIAVTKSSNSIDDLIEEVTIRLETIGTGQIKIEANSEDILDKINQLVDAYNELVEEIQAHTVYDPDNPDDTGVLFGNSTLHIIYDNIRRAMTSPVAGKDVSGDDGFSALSQIGLTLNSENQISIDDSILEDKLADNFEDVLNLFVSNGSGDYQVVTSNYLTQGGSYSTRIVDLAGGDYRLELKLEGSSEWITLEQSGQYAIGESGSLLEGVIIKTGELTAANLADVGNIDIYNGIAKVIQGYSGAFTALSSEGLIYNQLTTISNRDSDLEKEIENLNERVSLKEAELQREFAALETLLSKLKTEERYLTTQLEALVTN